jgi:hypothetical protein
MLRMAERKELAEPSDDEIQNMLAAVGADPTFASLPDDGKSLLLLGMFNTRLRLQIYPDLVDFERETPGPLLAALTDVLNAIADRHGLLTIVVDQIAEIRGVTVSEAWRRINQFVDAAQLMRGILEEAPAAPKVYDGRTVRSLRQRHEALMIRDCLKLAGVELRMTDPGDYDRIGDPGLALAVCVVRYTSGENIQSGTFRKRLSRAEGQFMDNEDP